MPFYNTFTNHFLQYGFSHRHLAFTEFTDGGVPLDQFPLFL